MALCTVVIDDTAMQEQTTAALARLRARWGEQFEERPGCPRGCIGPVWHDGERRRKASMRLEAQSSYVSDAPQRRKCCGVCRLGYTHHPEGITSRAHYQPCVVSHAIATLGTEADASTTSVAAEVGCAPSTVRRWVERVAAIAEPAALASALVAEADAPVLPSAPIALAERQRSPRLHTLLVRALMVLALLEALSSLRGYAPPALAHADRFIPASAPGPRNKRDPPLEA